MSWKKVKLKVVLDQIKIPVSIQDSAEYKLVTVSNKGEIRLRQLVKGYEISSDKAFKCLKGHFIYSRLSIHNGAFGIVPDDLEGALLTSEMPIFSINENIYPEFLIFSLKQPNFKNQIDDLTRGVGRTRVKENSFLNIEINLPPLPVQKQIIDYLKLVGFQRKELNYEQSYQLDLLKKLRQQILKDAMQGSLVSQNLKDESASKLLEKIKTEKSKSGKKEKPLPEIKPEEIPFEIPKNWVWCRLGEVVEMSRGRFSIRPRNDPRYFNGKYPFIQIGSLDENGSVIYEATQSLNEEGRKVSKEFPKGTIVIAIVGGTIGNLGVLGVNMCFTDSMVGIFPCNLYNQNYILNFLRYVQPDIKKAAYQMAGQPNIKIPTLTNLIFPLPPISEQNRIVEKIEELMALCDELEASVKANQEYTTLLYQSALKEALQPITFEVKQEDLAIAAEPQPTYFSQKNLLDFYQKQIIGHIVKQHNEHKMQQGEMVIAKDLYHLEKLYGINTHFQFQNWHYGTYDNKIRQLINGKDKYFKKEKVGNKGYEVLALGEKSENLFNPKYHKPELDLVEQSMKDLLKIYSTFPFKERSKRIELLNTVSKVISDTQSLDLATIREAMKLWKTPKAKFPTKADSFTPEETKECIDLILKQGWDKKLILKSKSKNDKILTE